MNSLIHNNKYLHITLIVIYALWVLNLDYFYPFVRFQSLKLNNVFSLCVQIIPMLLLINGFRFKHFAAKIINSLLSIILILISAAIAIIILFGISTLNINEAYKPVNNIKFDASSVVVYRVNGGATTDYRILVRQEKEIIKGVLLVKNLYNRNHMYDITIKKLDNNAVEINGEKIIIKQNIYFP